MTKILAVLAPENFRDEEYTHPREVWEQSGATVMTTSTSPKSIGRFNTEVKNDFLLNEVNVDDFDAIFFVGGGGCLDFMNNKEAENLAKEFLKNNKAVGAICAAPRLFLQWGILDGKKFTGWNGDNTLEDLGSKAGAIFAGGSIVIDGKILTASGPDSAKEAGEKFLTIIS
ncbi:DJ-1/PfpI family protein [Candidatus Gracilibacteria bacterium]|nr:DJ-1/PfpI family protein [Candidatus Gracilibacteria bacterium]